MKITQYFKVQPTNAKSSSNDLKVNQKVVMSNKEGTKDVPGMSTNSIMAKSLSNIRECQVSVKDIKHQFVNSQPQLFDEVPLNGQIICMTKKTCKFCEKEFSEKTKLHRHIKKAHPLEFDLLECEICNQKFFKKQSLNVHIKMKHPDGQLNYFECDVDGKVFRNKSEMKQHMEVHRSFEKCLICYKMLKPSSMADHLKDVHATGRQFMCKMCSKSFKSAQSLKIHEKTHGKKFQCQLCNKMFPSLGTLNAHKKTNHENPSNYGCEICDKKFNEKSILKRHQKTHDINRPKSIKCQQCDYATDNKYYFKYHQNVHQRQDQKFASMKNPIICQECPKLFKTNGTLRKHMKAVHPKDLHQCDLCAKFRKTKSSLSKHMELHFKK
jgi:KRAB domain-containing zinc finger protein